MYMYIAPGAVSALRSTGGHGGGEGGPVQHPHLDGPFHLRSDGHFGVSNTFWCQQCV